MQSSFLKRSRLVLTIGFLVFTFLSCIPSPESLAAPARLGEPMPAFTLPVYQGGEVKLSDLRGKNVMIFFLRGRTAPDAWCSVCAYQYAEVSEMEKGSQLRKKHNLEILFVLPYDRDTVKNWLDVLPSQLEKIRRMKYPPDREKLDDKTRGTMARYRQVFPKDPAVPKADLPILLDADRKVSKALDLFRAEWAGSKADQDVPTAFILDPKGIVRFKYFAQTTADRPSAEYLIGILDCIASGKK